MELFLQYIGATELLAGLGVALVAGVVKGIVGFAMPMIFVSLLGAIVSPEFALAGLILPTLVANGWQALRQGVGEAMASVGQFRVFLGVGVVFLFIGAQFVLRVPTGLLLLLIGVPVSGFAIVELLGVVPDLRGRRQWPLQAGFGAAAGLIGGFSGIWGPPTVMYLTAIGTEKRAQIRIQGIIYGFGSVALFVAHLASGVLKPSSLGYSALLIIPAGVGMWIGGKIQDRVDQRTFRRATLLVLLIAGLNLIRRGLAE